MLRNWQLATTLAIAISASSTISSVHAGGFGGFSGGRSSGGSSNHNHGGHNHNHSGHNHSNHNHSSHNHSGHMQSGGFNGGFNGGNFNGGNVIRSGNIGGINLGNAGKATPKNTGAAPIVRIGGTNNSGGGIKLPGLGNVVTSSNNLNKLVNGNSNGGSNVLKKINGNGSSIQSQVLGGLGIKVPGSGNGNGGGNGHNHSSNHNHNHHNHHHHCPPLVFTLPACNTHYCPPPPPIYYPQPYPVGVPVVEPYPVPVPVPVGEPMPVPVADPTSGPGDVAPAGGVVPPDAPQVEPTSAETPVEAQPAEAQPADAQPAAPPAADVVNKEAPLPQIPVGATLTLQGKDLTEKPGQVVLQLGEIALPATIKEWKNDSVVCTLPVLGLTKASKATLHVLTANGKTASTLNCELVTSLPTSVETAPSTASTGLDANKYEQ